MERINIEYEMQRHYGLTVMIEHKQKFPKSVQTTFYMVV